jgi:hypothetical protein
LMYWHSIYVVGTAVIDQLVRAAKYSYAHAFFSRIC